MLPLEVVVEVARGEIRLGGDLPHARSREPAPAEDPRGRAEDLQTAGIRPPLRPAGSVGQTIVHKLNLGSILLLPGAAVKGVGRVGRDALLL